MSCVFSVTLHLIFWGRVSHHTWSSHFGYIELTRKLPGIACLCVTGVQHHAWLLLRCLGLWSQVLYPPAIPRPLPSKFKCFINMSRTFINIDLSLNFWVVICIRKYWFCLYTLTFKYVSLPRTMSSCSFRLLHIHVFYPVQAYLKSKRWWSTAFLLPFWKLQHSESWDISQAQVVAMADLTRAAVVDPLVVLFMDGAVGYCSRKSLLWTPLPFWNSGFSESCPTPGPEHNSVLLYKVLLMDWIA